MGAGTSGLLIECCTTDAHSDSSRDRSLIVGAEIASMPADCETQDRTVFEEWVDPVEGVLCVLTEQEDLARRRELAAFAARPEPSFGPWKGTCSEHSIHKGCQCPVGHCGISQITGKNGCPLTRFVSTCHLRHNMTCHVTE